MERKRLQLYDCDRCGFTFRKNVLKKQRGLLLCAPCYDSALEIDPFIAKWRSPRLTNDPLAAVTNPIVFTITTSGITSLGRSQTFMREGVRNDYVMHVVGSGATTVVGNPAIVAGNQGTILTLVGTSNTDTVKFTDGNGIVLTGGQPLTLSSGSTATFTYDSSASVWRETSRT